MARTIRLPRNPGHATVHTGHYSGWTASVLYSLEYALAADIDYLVYVEQDVLLYGQGIIEHCIARMRKPLMFGTRGRTLIFGLPGNPVSALVNSWENETPAVLEPATEPSPEIQGALPFAVSDPPN